MFEAAAAALTVNAGGDIGGLANIGDCKQPTSPHNIAGDLNTESLPTLPELCKILGVDLKNNLVATMRQQSVAQLVAAGVSETKSNALYTIAVKRGFELCKLWERARELRVDADLDRRTLGGDVETALLDDRFVAGELDGMRGAARKAAENTIRVAAKRVAESFGKGGATPPAGAMTCALPSPRLPGPSQPSGRPRLST